MGYESLIKGDLDNLGSLLHESWMIKKDLTEGISNSIIDEYYDIGRNMGAEGGKLLGAGGGGFVLFYVKPEYHDPVIEKLKPLIHIPFKFESDGSKIVLGQI